MKFEEFEEEIWKRGYGITAFNHYSVNNERYSYCAILSRTSEKGIRAEGKSSEEVFNSIMKRLDTIG